MVAQHHFDDVGLALGAPLGRLLGYPPTFELEQVAASMPEAAKVAMRSRTLRRRLFWTAVACVLLLLAALSVLLRAVELVRPHAAFASER